MRAPFALPDALEPATDARVRVELLFVVVEVRDVPAFGGADDSLTMRRVPVEVALEAGFVGTLAEAFAETPAELALVAAEAGPLALLAPRSRLIAPITALLPCAKFAESCPCPLLVAASLEPGAVAAKCSPELALAACLSAAPAFILSPLSIALPAPRAGEPCATDTASAFVPLPAAGEPCRPAADAATLPGVARGVVDAALC